MGDHLSCALGERSRFQKHPGSRYLWPLPLTRCEPLTSSTAQTEQNWLSLVSTSSCQPLNTSWSWPVCSGHGRPCSGCMCALEVRPFPGARH